MPYNCYNNTLKLNPQNFRVFKRLIQNFINYYNFKQMLILIYIHFLIRIKIMIRFCTDSPSHYYICAIDLKTQILAS